MKTNISAIALMLALMLPLVTQAEEEAASPTVESAAPVAKEGGDKAAHRAMKEKMKKMTPEERKAFIESLPPEQREKMQKKRAEHKALMEKMRGATPEERKAIIESLPPEQQTRVKKHMEKSQERKAFKEKWKNASPEQRQEMLNQMPPKMREKFEKRMEAKKSKGNKVDKAEPKAAE